MEKRFLFGVGLLCLLTATSIAGAQKKPKNAGPTPPAASSGQATSLGAGAGAQSAAAAQGGVNVDPNTYVIGAEDQLVVRVWREPELSGPVSVRPDGKITLQLLREVQAAGRTPEQLATAIREGLSEKFIKNPEVTVTVQQVNSKKFYIQGEVTRSGPFPLLVPTTVLEALVNAGGFRDFANPKKIFVLRNGKRYYFNYRDVIKGKNMDQNILLQNGDIIIVP